MFQLVSAEEMVSLDKRAIEEMGIPGILLMENAASCVFDVICSRFPEKNPVAVVCGTGNNGGDGYAIARRLHIHGYPVSIFHFGEPSTEDARFNCQLAKNLNIPVFSSEDFIHSQYHLVVDAIFGTGLSRGIKEPFKAVINAMNKVKNRLAVDIPSGVNGTTGMVYGVCFKADLTVTFQFPKRGHYLQPGVNHRGELLIKDIGIPDDGRERPLVTESLSPILPFRAEYSFKNRFGHLLCIGGCSGTNGATQLAGLSALNCGCGLVTIASSTPPSSIELMHTPITLPPSDEEIHDFLNMITNSSFNSILIGPGLGRNEQCRKLVLKSMQIELPLIMDADAISNFQGETEVFISALQSRAGIPTVLTPHMGEFSRLLNIGTTSLEQSKFELTEDFCEQSGVTLVLKSASTLISSPGAETTLFHRPDSSLAKGGSGDVLAGIISALLAQGMEGFEAALNGVMLHSLTARHCRKQFSPYSVTPLDLIHALKGVTSLSPQQTQ